MLLSAVALDGDNGLFSLACFGDQNADMVLHFKTCHDVNLTEPPETTLGVILGHGTPLEQITDSDTRSTFILNDAAYWSAEDYNLPDLLFAFKNKKFKQKQSPRGRPFIDKYRDIWTVNLSENQEKVMQGLYEGSCFGIKTLQSKISSEEFRFTEKFDL